ncbi:MAG: methylenetetrahydrofolate reductase C-terminal domain-containing protein [Nitrospinota bacterium]
MIITKQKDFEDIVEAAKLYKSLFLVGCGDCATLCRTGGEDELKAMAGVLGKSGITVSGMAVVHATCHELDTQRVLRMHKDEVDKSDAFLVLTCGAGVQAVGDYTDKTDKPAISGCDSLFIGNSKRQMHFYEKCSACGDCVLNSTGGICPVTRCPKGLLNGPCGGAVRGKCEVNEEEDCIWITIFERMSKLGRLDDLMEIARPKKYSSNPSPGKIEQQVRPGK